MQEIPHHSKIFFFLSMQERITGAKDFSTFHPEILRRAFKF